MDNTRIFRMAFASFYPLSALAGTSSTKQRILFYSRGS